MNFAITGALEFFKNYLVHSAASVNQSGTDDGQAAAFFNFAGRAEKTLGPLQGVGVDPARKNFT